MMTTLKRLLVQASLAMSLGLSSPAQEAAEAESARLDRIAQLASQLQAPEADAATLFRELVRQAGFAIWNEERKVLAEPLGPRLRLAVTDDEIGFHVELFRNGDTVKLADLTAGFDVFWRACGVDVPCGPLVDAWRRSAFESSVPAARGLCMALQALGSQRHGELGCIDRDGDVVLDPLQALLLVRVIGEDLALPLRQALATQATQPDKPRGPNGWDPHAAPAFELPGWAEDGYAGTVTTLVGKGIENLDKFSSKVAEWAKESAGKASRGALNGVEKIAKGVSVANSIFALAKCIATYTCLKGELRVEAPGQPLVRTRSGPFESDAGELRTLVARFSIDGNKATECMKKLRPAVVLAGFDIDMPKSGALKGIETEWDIVEDRHSSKHHLIRLADRVDMSKIRTDDNGEARLAVVGRPQLRDLRKEQVLPIEKEVPIVVTPQVKSVEAQQDLVDAVFGALGVSGGPEGLVTPLVECLYRMKWTGGRRLRLKVRDWIPAEVVGKATIDIRASGATFGRESGRQHTIDRSLAFDDVKMSAAEVEAPTIDPEILRMMSAKQRESLEKSMAYVREMARRPSFQSADQGRAALRIRDRVTSREPLSECGSEVETVGKSVSGDAVEDFAEPPAGLRMLGVTLDLDAGTAQLTLYQSLMASVEEVRINGRKRESRRYEEEWGIFTDLELQGQSGNVITLQLQSTENVVSGGTDYYGVTSVPFTFGDGQFKGTALVTFSLHRRPKPATKPKSR
jgi:hypothetical protein